MMKRNEWWWISPPRKVGPLLIVLTLLAFAFGAYFVMMGMLQAAALVGLTLIIFILIGLVDLIGEFVRLSGMILVQLQKDRQED